MSYGFTRFLKGMKMILEAANKYFAKLHSDLLAIKHYIKNNVAVFITLLYLLGSFSGVIYLDTLLNTFSVNVFQHIELNDFLLALVSNPTLVLMYTSFIFILALVYGIELRRIPDPKNPTLFKKIYHGFSYPVYLLNPTYTIGAICLFALCTYPYIQANSYSEKIKEQRTQSYSLSLNDPIQQNKTTLLTDVQIVASTSRNLFIYDNKQEKLLIIPQNNIAAAIPNITADNII